VLLKYESYRPGTVTSSRDREVGRRIAFDMRLSFHIDLENGTEIGPARIALLEAVQRQGSIAGAARSVGMSYRSAWLSIEQINQALREPAVKAAPGGLRGGGAVVTQVGMQLIESYHAVVARAQAAAGEEIGAICRLARPSPTSARGRHGTS
jgi:molybdate transport system regulatory protein